MSAEVAFETWGPYQWLYTHVVLGRDEQGRPIPWTWVSRRPGVRRWLIPSLFILAALLGLWLVFQARHGAWWQRVLVLLLLVAVVAFAAHAWW